MKAFDDAAQEERAVFAAELVAEHAPEASDHESVDDGLPCSTRVRTSIKTQMPRAVPTSTARTGPGPWRAPT
jgi:hypothetical protein